MQGIVALEFGLRKHPDKHGFRPGTATVARFASGRILGRELRHFLESHRRGFRPASATTTRNLRGASASGAPRIPLLTN